MTSLERGGIREEMTKSSERPIPGRRYGLVQTAIWLIGLACSVVALTVLRLRKEGDSPLLQVTAVLLIGILPHILMYRNELRQFGPMARARRLAYQLTILSRAFVPLNILAYVFGGYFWVDEIWGAAWLYLSLFSNIFALLVPLFPSSRALPLLNGRFHLSGAAALALPELIVFVWWASGG